MMDRAIPGPGGRARGPGPGPLEEPSWIHGFIIFAKKLDINVNDKRALKFHTSYAHIHRLVTAEFMGATASEGHGGLQMKTFLPGILKHVADITQDRWRQFMAIFMETWYISGAEKPSEESYSLGCFQNDDQAWAVLAFRLIVMNQLLVEYGVGSDRVTSQDFAPIAKFLGKALEHPGFRLWLCMVDASLKSEQYNQAWINIFRAVLHRTASQKPDWSDGQYLDDMCRSLVRNVLCDEMFIECMFDDGKLLLSGG